VGALKWNGGVGLTPPFFLAKSGVQALFVRGAENDYAI